MIKTLPLLLALLLTPVFAQTGPPVWRFDRAGDLEGFTPANFASTEVRDGQLRGVTKYDCQLVSPPVSLDADRYKYLEFRASSTVTGGGELFFAHAGEPISEARMARFAIAASPTPRVYRVDLSRFPGWQGTITQFRFDLLNPAGAEVGLDYLRFEDRDWGKAPNPGFEDDFDGDGRPDGWQVTAAKWAWSAEHASQGDRSLMVQTGADAQATAALAARVPLDELGTFQLEATVTHSSGRATYAATLAFRDVFGKPLPDRPVTIPGGAPDAAGRVLLRGDFAAPALAASADLKLTAQGPAVTAWWDGVRVTHVASTKAATELPLESWRGAWIWAAATFGQDNSPAYLRYAFSLPVAPAQVTRAELLATADDKYQLFLNGREVAATGDPDGWRTPEKLDLRPYLVTGRNVLAVLARDVASSEGFLAEGFVGWKGGHLDLTSDGSWKSAGTAPEGWMAPGFDDSAWAGAKVIGLGGCPPWGNVPYEYLGEREAVKLVQKTAPAKVTGGGSLSLAAIVAKLPAAADNCPLRCSLLRDGREVVARTVATPAGTKRVAAGVQLGPLTLPVTRFLPPGKYQIALGYPHSEYAPGKGIVLGTVQVQAPARPEPPVRAEVRRHNGLPTLFLNGQPNSFMHYLELTPSPVRIGNMASAGLHLYELDADNIGWVDEGKFDYAAWDRKVLEVLTWDPQAVIIPTFDLSGLAHAFWRTAYPDEWCRTASGGTDVGIYGAAGKIISLASEKWRAASGDALQRFVRHCAAAPYGGRIVGYHPCSGVSWEWQHWGSVGPFEPTDYSAPMQAAFRAWVRKAYRDDVAALRTAWQKPEISFETVAIPTVPERDGSDHLLFRDPRTSRYVIDFYRFYQDVMVDGIEHYFRIIKETSGGKALTGTYYGYTATMLGGARRAGDSGHYALLRLLNSPLCDFLISPLDYSSRDLGEPYTIMSPIGSVLAHDKLWVLQADLRTHLVTDPGQREHGSPDGLDGTISQLQRAFANATAKGSATQWYDFSNGWIANDLRQGQAIGQLRKAGQEWVKWPNRGPEAEGIAVVIDEQTPACYLGHNKEVNYWLVYKQKATFERVGAPWNLYLLDDVTSGRLPKFKAYFFLNCFHMTDAQRAYVTRELQGDGRTLVWMYAPGFASDSQLDVKQVSELTGMDFAEVAEERPWRTDYRRDHALLTGLEKTDWTQPNFNLGPVFYPQGTGLDVAGTWEGTAWPSLAVKRQGSWTSVYSAGPLLEPRLIKNLCRLAGVPLTVASTEPSFVTRNFLALHSAVARTEQLTFTRPTTVTDLLTGEVLGRGVTQLQVAVPGPGTRLLRTQETKP